MWECVQRHDASYLGAPVGRFGVDGLLVDTDSICRCRIYSHQRQPVVIVAVVAVAYGAVTPGKRSHGTGDAD